MLDGKARIRHGGKGEVYVGPWWSEEKRTKTSFHGGVKGLDTKKK